MVLLRKSNPQNVNLQTAAELGVNTSGRYCFEVKIGFQVLLSVQAFLVQFVK